MKRLSPILTIALIAAFVCWWLLRVQTPASSPPENSTPKTAANSAANVAAPAVADASSSPPSPSEPNASTDLDTASEATTPVTAKPAFTTASFESARAASVLSRTPKGVWANRVPLLEDYVADIPADYVPAIANSGKTLFR